MGVPVWQVTLLVKDKESIGSDQFFKLNFFTHFIELNPQKYYGEVHTLGLVDLEDSQASASTNDPSRIEYFFGGQKPTNLYKD